MKNLKTIMLYTIKQSIQKKSFIVTNIIMIVIIILMFNVPNLLNKINKNEVNKILVVDSDNIFENTLPYLNEMGLDYEFEISNIEVTTDDLNEKINNKEYIAASILYKEDGKIKFDYIVKDIGKGMSPDMLKEILSQVYFNVGISKLNLTEAELVDLNTEIIYEAKTTEGEEEPEFSFSIIILSIALFFAIYFYAFQVSATVTMEKTSKVMETLVTSTKPSSIILGKTAGTGLLGIAQFAVMVLISIISYNVFMPENNTLEWLDFSKITPVALTIAFIYFLLGYTLYAFLYALVGSTVSKPEDIQTANAPVAMISMFGFYFGYFTVLFSPTTVLTKTASLVPFSSPFSMPFRMMMVNVPPSEVAASIAILFITILLVINISVKIYSSAVLYYGSKMSIKDMFELYKQK